MAPKVLLAISTFPDRDTAARICTTLVKSNLAACANILPEIRSIYRWKEKIEDSPETMVILKLSEDQQDLLQQKLRALHPYEVPEIIFVPVTAGLPEYLSWVAENSHD